jgi:uncharacterized OB-fold protein
MTAVTTGADLISVEAERIAARGDSEPVAARGPVNEAMIRLWTDAMGDRNPVYTDPANAVHGGIVAPPAMHQVWTMPGLHRPDALASPFSEMLAVLDAHGYTSVIATNSDQTYHRYLRPGELVTTAVRLDSVRGPKRTGMGEGYFVTAGFTWRVGAETVGEMLFRVLKFRPPAVGSRPQGAQSNRNPAKPVVSADTAFFWDGLHAGELRIQRCGGCGALRHPPGPLCPDCHSTDRQHVVASGHGEIYSYVVHHHPPVPGRAAPFVVAVVALDEGVRMVGNVLAEPGDVRIGAPVEVEFERVDDDLVLPSWRLA